MCPSLGLAAPGGRIGARSPRDPTRAVPRIWQFPHVPATWGLCVVTAVLQPSFDDVTLIHHRRTGKEYMYRFRGTHKHGDKDIVPLSVAIDNADFTTGEILLWASVAQPRVQGAKQKFLKCRWSSASRNRALLQPEISVGSLRSHVMEPASTTPWRLALNGSLARRPRNTLTGISEPGPSPTWGSMPTSTSLSGPTLEKFREQAVTPLSFT